MNYEGVCVYVEIIIDFLGSKLIDEEEERRIFGYFIYLNEYIF